MDHLPELLAHTRIREPGPDTPAYISAWNSRLLQSSAGVFFLACKAADLLTSAAHMDKFQRVAREVLRDVRNAGNRADMGAIIEQAKQKQARGFDG